MSARRSLFSLIAELGPEELLVLERLATRLLAGQRVYGRLDLARDPRDFRRERAEELADAFVYTAIAEVAATMPRRAPTAIDDGEQSADDLVVVEVDRAVG